MIKYKPKQFAVTFVWFEDGRVNRRRFRKYIEGLAWAEKNLTTDIVAVRILGKLEMQFDNQNL